MDRFEELKAEYNGFLSFLAEVIPNYNQDEASLYCTAAMLKIWGSNLLYSPDYTKLLSTITAENYTVEQVVTAMGCCGDTERQLLVPEFFNQVLDNNQHQKYASDVLEKLNSLLVGAAMINGDFTVEEASCLTAIIDSLVNAASKAGVRIENIPSYQGKITEKNDSSYLRNDALLAAARESKKKGTSANVEAPQSDPAGPVTINITLTASGGDTDSIKEANTQIATPEESPMVTTPDKVQNETMESLLAELDGLVGLESVKQDVHSLMNFIKVTKIREKRGMKVPTISYHLVFTGNPGTGKTTVARLVAKLYYHMGILPQGQLVETDRSALVAGYLGQTAIKTQKVIQQAMGGVLFIDEAYSLAGETDDSYGKEAIETILKAMEDHRDEFVVIVAGYTDLMHKFIESNPGLSSRFSKYFEYPDYSGEELLAIFNRFCEKNGYVLDSKAAQILKDRFDMLYESRDKHFGNARTARNIFEKAINAQADRIALQTNISDLDLEILTAADIITAIGGAS